MPSKFPASLALLTLAVSGCQRHEPPSAKAPEAQESPAKIKASPLSGMSEQAFRSGMALDSVKDVRYVGEAGEDISFGQFLAAVQAGGSFSKLVDTGKSLAVITLNAKAVGAPDLAAPTATAQALKFPISTLLPPITTRDLAHRLPVLANGKNYTLVSFFFAECVPCIHEIPALNAMMGIRKDLDVVSVTFDPEPVASEFVRKRGLRTSVVPDSQDYIESLGVTVYPTLMLVSPEGRLMGVRSSYAPAAGQDAGVAELKAWITSLGLPN